MLIKKQEEGLRDLQSFVKDEFDKIETGMERLDAEIKARPTQVGLYRLIGCCAIAVLVFVLALVEKGAGTTKEVVKAQLEASEARMLRAIEGAKHTQQMEIRAMQEVVLKRKRSPVLEQPVPPPPDGGTPTPENP